jgi:O-antigen/teichoic acid export membrane protein
MSETNGLDVQDIASKAVYGSAFNIGSTAITLVLGFVRSVLLARLLVPEDFGVMALAIFFLRLVGRVHAFDFDAAFTHRHIDCDEVVSTHFVLRLVMGVVLASIAVIAAPFLQRAYPGHPRLGQVLTVLAVLEVIKWVNSTPQVLLSKELRFKRLALLDVSGSTMALVVAVPMALSGAGVWSLVGEQASGVLVRVIGLWGFRRPWNVSLRVDWGLVKWYFSFGIAGFLSSNLNFLLDRFDDFWTGTALGSTALGLYSKAYEFAHYPRRVVADPVAAVFFPAFAGLQHDRERLSKAYFRVCSLVIRAGFLFAGVLVLVTPEFIHLFLGDKWLPMAFTFQLMLIYTLFDPLLVISSRLTTAVGEPRALTKVKFTQLLFFVPAVITLARFFGINGVAVAADLMLVLGIVIILARVRRYVDFSLWRMMGYPALGLALALSAALLVQAQLHISGAVSSLLSKAIVATVVYGAVLLTFEWEQLLNAVQLVSSLLMGRGQPSPS